VFRLETIVAVEAIVTVGRLIPSGNLSLAKITLVSWMSGSSTQMCWDRYGCIALRFVAGKENQFWLKGYMFQGRRAVTLRNIPQQFVLQLRKSTESLS